MRAKKTGKYKSALESKVAQLLGKEWIYEEWTVPYTLEKNYVVDFSKDALFIEVKAFFRPGDIAKYKAVARALEGTEHELVFVLANPLKKVRKGSKTTMAQWCDKNGFRWYSVNSLSLIKEIV